MELFSQQNYLQLKLYKDLVCNLREKFYRVCALAEKRACTNTLFLLFKEKTFFSPYI